MQQDHIRNFMKGETMRPPSRVQCNKFRQMIPWLVYAQVGMLLTKSYWRCKQDKQVMCSARL